MTHARPGSVVTVIVPTFNERDSVAPLLDRLATAVGTLPVDVLFVDDSTDDTPQVIDRLSAASALPIRMIHRTGDERTGGLGGAVLAGLRADAADWVVVMDSDLQHPPEVVPELLARAIAVQADVVVASRYTAGGSAGGLSGAWRHWVSGGAGRVARMLFPGRLRGCTDPMSGFFLVRRAAVDVDRLAPDGFKILLEVLGRHGGLRIAEVPFAFGRREAGESKAGLRQGLIYLRHLVRLRFGRRAGELAGFLAVGATGVLPNLLTVALLTLLGLNYVVATVAATVVAGTSNFLLTDLVVFRQRRTGRLHHRWLGYVGLSAADIALRVPVVAGLVELAGVPLLVATVSSIVLAGVARFLVLDRWFYRLERPAHRTRVDVGRAEAGSVDAGRADVAPGHLVLAEAMRGVA